MLLSEETRGVRFTDDPERLVLDEYDRYLIERKLWGWEKPPEIGYNEIKPLVNPLPKEHHVTQWCGDRAVEWLSGERPSDRPFFLWVSFVKPHVPYDCPEHLVDLYDESLIPEPWVSSLDGSYKNPYLVRYREQKEFDLYSRKPSGGRRPTTTPNITFIDEQVGRILDALDAQGLTESTLVVFTSDHGDLMGDHDLWYKSFGYEGSIRVPMLVRQPGRVKREAAAANWSAIWTSCPRSPTPRGSIGPTTAGHEPVRLPGRKRGLRFPALRDHVPARVHGPRAHQGMEIPVPPERRLRGALRPPLGPQELVDLSGEKDHAPVLAELRRKARRGSSPTATRIRPGRSGRTRAEPFRTFFEPAGRPFSRMPWDLRLPPSRLPEKQRGWFWAGGGADWSRFIGSRPEDQAK
jgi:hypothetical protein